MDTTTMTPLKFRAWDKKAQDMRVSPDEVQHLGSWFDAHLPGALADVENKIIMQSTGLNDCDDKEVYEGDIIGDPIGTEDWNRAVVIWDEPHARFGLEFYSPHGGEGYTGAQQHIHSYLGCIDWPVIGNIYENESLVY